jgi:hypothetical protein
MRIGVLRDDISAPLPLGDLEPVSRYNPAIEPRGQERYLGRPQVSVIESKLADATVGAGATIQGTDLTGTFPILIVLATNDVLRLKTSSGASFTDVTIAAASYADRPALLAGINAALNQAGLAVSARAGTGSGIRVALESTEYGVDSYVELDTVGNGSTANTDLGLSDGARTMPAASVFITDLSPDGGPIDVQDTTITAVGTGTAASALSLIPSDRGTVEAIADVVAPMFFETDVVIDSFLVGMLSEYRSASWNPDPNLWPTPPANGAAISVLQDDGVTPFVATIPTISSATLGAPGAGDVTIAGTGLGSSEKNQTTVKFTGDVETVIAQELIVAAGGSVSPTAVVVPASLIPGAATTTTSVEVKVRHRASAVEALA